MTPNPTVFKIEWEPVYDPEVRLAIGRRLFNKASTTKEPAAPPPSKPKLDGKLLRERRDELIKEIERLKSEKRSIFTMIATQSTAKAVSFEANDESKNSASPLPSPKRDTVLNDAAEEEVLSQYAEGGKKGMESPRVTVAQRTSLLALFENPEVMAQLQAAPPTTAFISSPLDLFGQSLSPSVSASLDASKAEGARSSPPKRKAAD